MLRIATRALPSTTQLKSDIIPRRNFWHWLNVIFNRVDESRVKAVGPDIACAEWLLKNGASVKWTGALEHISNYNSLSAASPFQTIEEVDGSGSSISHYGFLHFKDCKGIKKIILHKCTYIDDKAMATLKYVQSPLKYLEISSCPDVTDKGLLNLPSFKNLQNLVIFDLISVQNIEECKNHIKNIMPSCEITSKK